MILIISCNISNWAKAKTWEAGQGCKGTD